MDGRSTIYIQGLFAPSQRAPTSASRNDCIRTPIHARKHASAIDITNAIAPSNQLGYPDSMSKFRPQIPAVNGPTDISK